MLPRVLAQAKRLIPLTTPSRYNAGNRVKLKGMKRFALVLVSLALHAALLLLVSIHTAPALIEPLPLAPVEIVNDKSFSPKQPERGKIVETERSGRVAPHSTPFVGKQDQSVARQTRAPETRAFSSGNQSAEHLGLSDLGIDQSWRNRAAATDDDLEGIAPDQRTVLNTRALRYFSFYERVKSELRIYWKPEVEDRVMKLAAKGLWPNDRRLVTKVVVLLQSDGKVAKVSTSQSCGFAEIDGAADYAFERAARFPNVPKGMIDSDGYARLYWDFVLLANGKPLVRTADSHSTRAADRLN